MEKVIINYPGLHRSTGACGVAYDQKEKIAVVVEIDGHCGTSVTNAAEIIAPIVAEKLMQSKLGDFRLFEVYQHRIRDGVDYDASEVFIRNGAPNWNPVSDSDKEMLKPFLKRWELRHPRLY